MNAVCSGPPLLYCRSRWSHNCLFHDFINTEVDLAVNEIMHQLQVQHSYNKDQIII